jgi:DNA repair exonuclease SbcCD nuclease subunit
MTLNLAFFADSHLGYRAKVKNNSKGINTRVQDGYDALKEITRGILTSDVKIDGVIHGGDFAHTSQPSVRDITVGNFYLRKLAEAGIPVWGVGGNHDSSDIRADLPAVAAFHDPERKIHMVYEPYKKFEIADGVMLHAMSHHGLHEGDAPEINVSSDVINIFTTHGAAIDPKNQTLLRCIDSPREQIIPVEMITEGMFNVNLLGHYHSRYAVGNEVLNTWYAGSAIRRGFTDEPGQRGWLLIQIEPNGKVTVTPKDIPQRPQFDLPIIDAADLNPSEIMDLLESNIDRTVGLDSEPIVRQRIKNANRIIREGLDYNRINDLKEHMLLWQLELLKPEVTVSEKKVSASLSSNRSVSIIDNYKRFTEEAAKNVPEKYRDIVVKSAEKYLAQARDLSELEGSSH